MPLLSIMWNVGSVVGPILGGFLSTPAQQYPNSFVARVRLFQDFPYVYRSLLCYSHSVLSLSVRYLLSCLAGASIIFAVQILGYFCLEETREHKDKVVPMFWAFRRGPHRSLRVKPFNSDHEDRTPTDTDTLTTSSSSSITVIQDKEESSSAQSPKFSLDTNPSTSPSALELLRHLPLQRVITSAFILNILDTGYTAVFCLLCDTPIHLGGLSRTVRTLSCLAHRVLTSI